MFPDHVQFGQSAHHFGWNGAKWLYRGNKQEQNSRPSLCAWQSGRKLGRCKTDYSLLQLTVKSSGARVLPAVFWCCKTDSCNIQISWKIFPVSPIPDLPNGKIQLNMKWNIPFQMQLYWHSRNLRNNQHFLKLTGDKVMDTYTWPSRCDFELRSFVPDLGEDRKYGNINSNWVSVLPLSTNLIFFYFYTNINLSSVTFMATFKLDSAFIKKLVSLPFPCKSWLQKKWK